MFGKKNYYLLLLLALSYYSCIAQVNWKVKADMPTARKEIADAVTVFDDKFYVLGGRTSAGTITNAFEVYDPISDSWASLTPYPISVWRASLATVNGKIYAMGGYKSLNPFPFNPTEKAYVYDPISDSWSAIQDIPIQIASASSVVLNNKIHLLGGENSLTLNDHRIYDPVTDVWTTGTSLLQERASPTASIIDGKIYVAGGYYLSGGVNSLSSAEMFDPNSNSWSFIESMPFTKLGITSAVYQEKMYVFGNENNTNVLEYDPFSNAWSQVIEMPEDVNFAGAVSIGDSIYLVGGGPINLASDGISALNCLGANILSINAIENELSNLNIYPNPTFNKVNIKYDLEGFLKEFRLEIYSATGHKLKSQPLINTNIGVNKLTIDLALYNAGIYFLKISTKKGHFITKKIIKK